MKEQRGGFLMGMIVGLLLGLAIALVVAVVVTKVPVPFVDKVPQRTAEQDAAEAERNRNWNPNAPLAGKNPARPATAVSGVLQPAPGAPASAPAASPAPAPTAAAAANPTTAAAKPAAAVASAPAVAPAASAPASGGFTVQAGAFERKEDAEQQRGRLALLSYEAKVVEREQAGKIIYRVRVGPFDKKEAADELKNKLAEAGITAVVMPNGR
jgi:cell division protein FtsN